ncbi:unnamed protein product [Prorocentrum cordatum]|uniref:Uncharacterized protein n=1 Tax=Prorocentrum cordatum TaxID=2364126 RepID=A0ABN9TJT9_9DINO|nr:unnamed protein product [Polarella glacialis]
MDRTAIISADVWLVVLVVVVLFFVVLCRHRRSVVLVVVVILVVVLVVRCPWARWWICLPLPPQVTGSIEVSVCIHPLSFDQWAKTSGSRRKFTVGWPVKAGSQASGFQIAKAYSALQSLKRRYSIADGDADVLIVKELLSAASSATAAASTAAGARAAAAAPPAPSQGFLSPWEHDIGVFGSNMARGLPGVEKEIHDTIWNVEHIENRGVATMLLRSVLMIAAVYLVGGAVYKNQTYGSSGVDAIPHIGFWREYPQLVLDGVQYATGFGRQFMGKGAGGGDFEPLSGGLSGRGF